MAIGLWVCSIKKGLRLWNETILGHRASKSLPELICYLHCECLPFGARHEACGSSSDYFHSNHPHKEYYSETQGLGADIDSQSDSS